MSKVTSFTMPNRIRQKLDEIIELLKAKTGDQISMAAAICTAIDYYHSVNVQQKKED